MKKLLAILICTIMLLSLTSCAKHEINNIFQMSVIDCNIENYNAKVEEVYDAEEFMPSILSQEFPQG